MKTLTFVSFSFYKTLTACTHRRQAVSQMIYNKLWEKPEKNQSQIFPQTEFQFDIFRDNQMLMEISSDSSFILLLSSHQNHQLRYWTYNKHSSIPLQTDEHTQTTTTSFLPNKMDYGWNPWCKYDDDEWPRSDRLCTFLLIKTKSCVFILCSHSNIWQHTLLRRCHREESRPV